MYWGKYEPIASIVGYWLLLADDGYSGATPFSVHLSIPLTDLTLSRVVAAKD